MQEHQNRNAIYRDKLPSVLSVSYCIGHAGGLKIYQINHSFSPRSSVFHCPTSLDYMELAVFPDRHLPLCPVIICLRCQQLLINTGFVQSKFTVAKERPPIIQTVVRNKDL